MSHAAIMAKHPEIKNDSFINILLLGETGVGKSTFINSMVNYLTYPDFEIAEKEELIILISSQFTVRDKFGDYHIIKVGPEDDQNECLDTGMSATQDVKSYVFPIWNGAISVRLIDTPGIGDGRGIDQDNINCEKILDYIGQLQELHAICYLFKPTNSRITVYFDYCMTQILSRLDKSASRNMIFIFTNTRGSDYTPGDTFPILKKVIDGIKSRPPHVDLPLNKNVFCFDNEALRYVAAAKQNIKFNFKMKQTNCESWTWSAEQCNNLINYIVGDSKHPPLKPHIIKSTNAVNEARRLIVQLSRPLAEISQLISDNLFTLQRHEEALDMNSNTLDELKKKLFMPVIDLEIIPLSQPVTVCASQKCANIYKVRECNKWHYKQRCHDPCHLKNVPKEIIGNPELANCSVIKQSTGECTRCGCNFSVHMHVYYLTKTVENKIIDKNIKKNMENKKKLLADVRKLVEDISTRKDELEKEHSIIIKTCAKFAHFLQNNAITPFNDSYKEYIEYLIMCEKRLGHAQKSVIRHLEKSLREYNEAKQFFVEALALQNKMGNADALITPQNIQENIQELYELKHNGKKIKELYECQIKSRAQEHKYKEYVHKVISILKRGWRKQEEESSHSHTNNDLHKGHNKAQHKIWEQYPSSSQVCLHDPQNKHNFIQMNADLVHLQLQGQSPTPVYEELPSTIQVYSQDSFTQCPPHNEPRNNPQHVPEPDFQITATNVQITNTQQTNENQAQHKISDQSSPSTTEELTPTLQIWPHDPLYRPNNEPQSHP